MPGKVQNIVQSPMSGPNLGESSETFRFAEGYDRPEFAAFVPLQFITVPGVDYCRLSQKFSQVLKDGAYDLLVGFPAGGYEPQLETFRFMLD